MANSVQGKTKLICHFSGGRLRVANSANPIGLLNEIHGLRSVYESELSRGWGKGEDSRGGSDSGKWIWEEKLWSFCEDSSKLGFQLRF